MADANCNLVTVSEPVGSESHVLYENVVNMQETNTTLFVIAWARTGGRAMAVQGGKACCRKPTILITVARPRNIAWI